MTKAARSIERGLRQAIAHAKERRTGDRKAGNPKARVRKTGVHETVGTKGRRQTRPAIVHEVRIGTPDVAAIRARTGLSQAAFARSIGVAKGTVLNWEQRRRSPDGPARVLLALIEKDPNIVQRALARR